MHLIWLICATPKLVFVAGFLETIHYAFKTTNLPVQGTKRSTDLLIKPFLEHLELNFISFHFKFSTKTNLWISAVQILKIAMKSVLHSTEDTMSIACCVFCGRTGTPRRDVNLFPLLQLTVDIKNNRFDRFIPIYQETKIPTLAGRDNVINLENHAHTLCSQWECTCAD
jgi:hypothetical protein